MIITKKAIPRRTILRGLGASLALPFLDSMVPAMVFGETRKAPRRFAVTYAAHGAAPGHWVPSTVGADYELTRPLASLAPFKDRIMVLSGIDNEVAMSRAGDPRGGHGRMAPAFMSGEHCKPTQGGDYRAGITIDQIVADKLGSDTQVASLNLSVEPVEFSGTCDSGYSCVYTNTLCWRGPTAPLPMEYNPRSVFERLFGDSGSTDPAVRSARLQQKKSILDSVQSASSGLVKSVGSSDRHLLDGYFEAIRDVERRVEVAEAQSGRELPVIATPTGVPENFADYARLLYDLQVLAFQADLTRVVTFMLAKEVNSRTYPEIGVTEGHHALSHHGNLPEKKDLLARVNAYHVSLFSHFLEKLAATKDGDGTLLDHMVALYGSGHGDANIHDPHELPIIVAGGLAVRQGQGRHVRYDHAQLPDLHVTLLNKVGVEVNKVGESKGSLPFDS